MADRTVVAPRFDGRMLFGIVLLALGVLFTLDNLNLYETDAIVRWWPVVIVLVGVAKLFGIGTTRHVFWGGLFTVFGTLMLGDSLDQWDFEFWNFWPLFMIFVGAMLLMRGFGRGPLHRLGQSGTGAPGAAGDAGDLRSWALMSGVTRRISGTFTGGELSAVMGGVEIDLRNAQLADGVALIEVFVWWGGIDVRVPEGWTVVNEGMAIMGAIEDTTKVPGDGRNRLIVRGLVVMGGVEVKN